LSDVQVPTRARIVTGVDLRDKSTWVQKESQILIEERVALVASPYERLPPPAQENQNPLSTEY